MFNSDGVCRRRSITCDRRHAAVAAGQDVATVAVEIGTASPDGPLPKCDVLDACNVPSPDCRTAIVAPASEPCVAVTGSGSPSPLKSPRARACGSASATKLRAALKVPSGRQQYAHVAAAAAAGDDKHAVTVHVGDHEARRGGADRVYDCAAAEAVAAAELDGDRILVGCRDDQVSFPSPFRSTSARFAAPAVG
jgi:hypothetical protein